MRLATFLVILLALASLPAPCISRITVNSAVTHWASTVFTQWTNAYNLLRPDVTVNTYGATSPEGLAALEARTVDFAVVLSALSAAQRAGGFRQWPATVAQTIVTYNLNDTIPVNSLNLTAEALCNIWTGKITTWDDPAIVAHNPLMPLEAVAGQPIVVIYRSDYNAGTLVFTQFMSTINCTSWNSTYGTYGVTFQQFPSFVTSLPNWMGFAQTVGTVGAVVSIPWSISFAEQSWSIDNEPLLPTVAIECYSGGFASPYETSGSAAAIDYVQLNVNNTGKVANLPGPDVYPFLSFGYLVLNVSWSDVECDKYRELLLFIHWALTDPDAQQISANSGTINLPTDLRNTVLNLLSELQCGGQELLRIVEIQQHTGVAFPLLLALSMFFWALAIVSIGAAWYFGSRSKNPLFYAACLVVGVSLAFASLIFFYLVPRDTWVCQLRQWLLCLGLSLLFGVVFARGWQLHTLHLKRDSTAAPSKKDIVSTKALAIIMGIVLGVQLILLICWTAIDHLHTARVYPNTIDLDSRFVCHSHVTVLWLVLELAYFLCLLGWGMYVVYRTWQSRAAVDSRWTLIAIYNTLMVVFVVIPLLATVAKTDDWVFFIAVLAADWAIISAVGSIYGSVLLRRIWDRVSGSGSGSSKDDKVSTFRTSMSGEGTIA